MPFCLPSCGSTQSESRCPRNNSPRHVRASEPDGRVMRGLQPAVDQDIGNRCCGPSHKGREWHGRPSAIILSMERPALHISEADLTKDIVSILRRMQTGAEAIIERDAQPVAVLRPIEPVRRKISECIALLPEDSVATVDPDFAKDVEEAIAAHREPLEPPAWD